jgi:glycosyltransferase involved in cell wall biosynthesis
MQTENLPLNVDLKEPLRIVLVHPSAGVNWSGGAEVLSIELARRLSRYFEVELLCGADCGSFSYPIKCVPRAYAFAAVRHPLIAPFLRNFSNPEIVIEHLTSFFPSLFHLLRKPADLIFPHNDYGGLAMAACARLIRKTPILFLEHNGLLGKGENGLGNNGNCLRRNLKFKPDHLVVFDQASAEFVRSEKPAQKMSVIPNGVNLEQFTPDGEFLDIDLPKPLVLCVASLNRQNQKRVELAIQAVSRLGNASLLVCGDGPDRLYFQALGEQLFGTRFAIRTFPFSQMPTVYRSADVLTLPSIHEPFGLVYLEAMASGVPVVATDDEMRRYVVGDGGILCDVMNIDAYAQALSDALNQDWTIRARKSAARFDWDAIALRYRDVILQTIHQSQK